MAIHTCLSWTSLVHSLRSNSTMTSDTIWCAGIVVFAQTYVVSMLRLLASLLTVVFSLLIICPRLTGWKKGGAIKKDKKVKTTRVVKNVDAMKRPTFARFNSKREKRLRTAPMSIVGMTLKYSHPNRAVCNAGSVDRYSQACVWSRKRGCAHCVKK